MTQGSRWHLRTRPCGPAWPSLGKPKLCLGPADLRPSPPIWNPVRASGAWDAGGAGPRGRAPARAGPERRAEAQALASQRTQTAGEQAYYITTPTGTISWVSDYDIVGHHDVFIPELKMSTNFKTCKKALRTNVEENAVFSSTL